MSPRPTRLIKPAEVQTALGANRRHASLVLPRGRLRHPAEEHRGPPRGPGPDVLRRDRPGAGVPAQLRHRPQGPEA